MKELFTVGFILLAPAVGNTSNEQAAINNASIACYKQSGIEDMVNKYTEDQLRHMPTTVKTVAGNAFLIAKSVQEKKVTYKWSF